VDSRTIIDSFRVLSPCSSADNPENLAAGIFMERQFGLGSVLRGVGVSRGHGRIQVLPRSPE
jgi:hypothetical protein